MDYSKLEKAKAEAKRFLEAASRFEMANKPITGVDSDFGVVEKCLQEAIILRRDVENLYHALAELRKP